MSRYIDAEHFDERIRLAVGLEGANMTDDFKDGIQTTLQLLGTEPTADVVEVVRCKDCKWFNQIGCAICIVDDSDKPTENDYCSFGERSEDAEIH